MEVKCAHTPDMLREELRAMLAMDGWSLTAGGLAALEAAGSPLAAGRHADAAQVAEARRLMGVPDGMADARFLDILARDARAASRAQSLLMQGSADENGEREPDAVRYTPEWLADVMAAASAACPAMSWRELLWTLPLAAAIHLAGAAARRAGRRTPRPLDEDGLAAAFAAIRTTPHPVDWDAGE